MARYEVKFRDIIERTVVIDGPPNDELMLSHGGKTAINFAKADMRSGNATLVHTSFTDEIIAISRVQDDGEVVPL